MFEVDFGLWPQAFSLVLARVAGLVGSIPFFWGTQAAGQIRFSYVLIISLLLTPLVPPEWMAAAAQMQTGFGMFIGMLGEVLLGGAVGLICNLFLGAIVFAGDLSGQSAGLLMAQEVDPQTGVNSTLMTTLMQTVFIMAVVLNNGHLALLRVVAESVYHVQPGLAWINEGWMHGLIALGSAMYDWGLRLGAPAVATVLILDAGFALIAKFAPDFEILFMSIPIRLSAILAVFGLTLQYGDSIMTGMIQRMLKLCSNVLTG